MITKKPFYVSKTMVASLIVAVVPFIPTVGPAATAWIAANPALFSAGLGAVFAALRAITGEAISFT